jgi:polysaccharide deacetylase 2 family uncharacterized protein YibQ
MFWGCVTIKTNSRKRESPDRRFKGHRTDCGARLHRIVLVIVLGLLTHNANAFAAVPRECGSQAGSTNGHSHAIPNKQLVIVIDDLGHSLARGREALALPGKLTFAVIPHTRYGTQLAEAAHTAGKEVMLHAPMSTLEDIPLGPGGLTPQLSRREFRAALHNALEQVPHVQGINNHMGSDLTQRRQQMAWLMQELRWQELYFVDSRTSDKTVAATVAAEFNVPNLSRQIFLDNERSVEAIDERFKELLARVEQDGLAIAIGHPYAVTLNYLREALPRLHEQGVKLVFVSEALQGNVAMELADDNYRRTSIPCSAI